jgi:hypothetical protein
LMYLRRCWVHECCNWFRIFHRRKLRKMRQMILQNRRKAMYDNCFLEEKKYINWQLSYARWCRWLSGTQNRSMWNPMKEPIKVHGNNIVKKYVYILRLTQNDRSGTWIKLLISHNKIVTTFLSNIFEDQSMKTDVRILQVLATKLYSRV